MKKKLRFLPATLCLLILLAGSALYLYSRTQAREERRHLYMMDTLIEIVFYGPNAPGAADALETKLKRWEENTSLYCPQGDIGRLNAKAGDGEPVALSEEVFSLLQNLSAWSLKSESCFDPTIAPLTLLWNVRGENPQVPSARAVAEALSLVDVGDLQLDPTACSAKLMRPGQAVDLGGAAKGAASALAFETMEDCRVANGYVSFGGNLAVRGKRPDGKDFRFGVRDPWGSESAFFATLSLEGKTMATTGDYIRYFEENGVRYSHLLDPRTGYPAKGELCSVSVVAKDGALADFLSTALFIAGKDAVLARMQEADFQLIAVDREKNVYVSAGLQENLQPNPDSPDFNFHFL